MDPLTIATAAGVGLVALGTRWFVGRYAMRGTAFEQLRRAKRSTIAAVKKDGKRVKVGGRVQPVGEPLVSPFGERRCVAYRVRVIVLTDHDPVELVDEVDLVPFRLEDDTGRARVAAETIRLVVDPVRVLDHEGGGPAGPALRAFLSERAWGAAMSERVVVEQAVVEVGEAAEVLGCARLVVDPERAGRNYREPGRELMLGELPDGSVIVGRPTE